MELSKIYNHYLFIPIIYILLSLYINYKICKNDISSNNYNILDNLIYRILFISIILFFSYFDTRIAILLSIYYTILLYNYYNHKTIYIIHNIIDNNINKDKYLNLKKYNNLDNYIKKDKYYELYDNITINDCKKKSSIYETEYFKL